MWKSSLQNGRKYLQIIYLIRGWYLEYMKNKNQKTTLLKNGQQTWIYFSSCRTFLAVLISRWSLCQVPIYCLLTPNSPFIACCAKIEVDHLSIFFYTCWHNVNFCQLNALESNCRRKGFPFFCEVVSQTWAGLCPILDRVIFLSAFPTPTPHWWSKHTSRSSLVVIKDW